MSLAEKYTDKKPLLESAVNLLKNEEIFHKEKIGIIKRIIEMEIEAFIPDDEEIKIEGDVKMSDDDKAIFDRVVNEVNIKKEQEAMEKGRLKEKKDIARKMKKHLSPEVISKFTGLSVNTILLL